MSRNPSNPNYPSSKTHYVNTSYLSKVLQADPEWQRAKSEQDEYEMSSNDGTGRPRIFKGWYSRRGNYGS